jgi:hypothetical protein
MDICRKTKGDPAGHENTTIAKDEGQITCHETISRCGLEVSRKTTRTKESTVRMVDFLQPEGNHEH